MRQFTFDDLSLLLSNPESPCISLYLPTHRVHPENQQDPIRYRNLLGQLEETLALKYSKKEVESLLSPFQALAYDQPFWNHRTEGLAILCSPGIFEVFDLQTTVSELLIVADSFHTKPLLRMLQSSTRYQILVLDRHQAKLYEGDQHFLDEVPLSNLPSTIEEALGSELTDSHLNVGSYGAGAPRPNRGTVAPSVHAHGDKKDEIDNDRDRFFRIIDHEIHEQYSRPSRLPLILASLQEYQAPFRKLSHNPHLMEEGIRSSSQSLDVDQLREEAWRIIEPVQTRRVTDLVEKFHRVSSLARGSDVLPEVAQAVSSGRVSTLLIEENRQIPGKFHQDSGAISPQESEAEFVDDVLDDLAESVLKMKGEVLVIPSSQMPTKTGAAAIYRY